MALLDPNRLLPTDPAALALSQQLYAAVADLPIISPHGHCDPRWFAQNARFPNPAELFVVPDHYVFRMLASQGVELGDLGIARTDGGRVEEDPRAIWRRFAEHFYLFAGTPSWMWLNHAFETVFDIDASLNGDTAEAIFDAIDAKLALPEFRPRALFDRFNVECLATTEGALDPLDWHRQIRDSGWGGRVITTYRPDTVVDPQTPGFAANVEALGGLTGHSVSSFQGYLAAHRARRAFFQTMGATATDHGHPTARTENLDPAQAEALYQRVLTGAFSADEADAFRGQMLTEMARMSLDDGLTLQIHSGSFRNHSKSVFETFGRDKGFDIPTQTDYVQNLKPLLDAVGMESTLTVILFTLDETVYSRELAPLAGAYPALKLGPPWWFHDSFEGMMRFRQRATETAGFYNTAGFNDDTRAFCSIPARHDVARRVDCHFLANLVVTGRMDEASAHALAPQLAYGLAKKAYKL